TLLQMPNVPDRWRELLDRLEAAREAGENIRGQVCGRPPGVMLALDFSRNPFSNCASYMEVAGLGDEDKLAALRDPGRRARILSEFAGLDDDSPFALQGRF